MEANKLDAEQIIEACLDRQELWRDVRSKSGAHGAAALRIHERLASWETLMLANQSMNNGRKLTG